MTSPQPNASPAREVVDRRVLVVEDDPTVLEVATSYLRSAGLIVSEAVDGPGALAAIAADPPDLIVLDRMLPGMDGIDVCRRVRESSRVPILMLTALGATDDRITGLEAGADDYLTKPFSPRELTLRVQSILRRSPVEASATGPVTLGPFVLDTTARTVTSDGAPLALSVREFDLFAFLLTHPQQAFSREQLLKSVWHWEFGDLSTVTVTVRRVREKIEADPTDPIYLVTVWGVGYRLDLGGGHTRAAVS
ncbi:MAG: DNA-binding response regulator [Microbacterium sp.]|uniref:response regulator transcription factor n=1 Tax=unclassified Microbacterium TaxID=2609290 RepID=UPI000DB65FDF|nr:response regulator transcription factor [Microbacterium sp.]PZU41553.1 MAG: DNA-binding response regulator [Microbacterium sp.]